MTSYRYGLTTTLGALLLLTTACARATRVQSEPIATDPTLLRESLQDAFMAQEIYYSHPANKYAYAADVARLERYRPRPGIVLTIFEGTAQGWSGMAQDASGHACVIFVGKVSKMPVTPRGTTATKPAHSRNFEVACDASPAK